MKLDDKLKMNLQYFAEDPGDGDAGQDDDQKPEDQNNGENGGEKNESDDDRTFTRGEIAKMINAETKKLESKYENMLDDKFEEGVSEGQRLAEMTEEKRQEEKEKRRQSKLDEREAELNRREMRATTSDLIREEGLPQTFVDLVVADEAEAVQENIKNVKQVFDEAVEAEVDKRLVQKNTKTGTAQGSLTKKEILRKKDKAEREKLISENMDLFT
jgi:hypothetical protein